MNVIREIFENIRKAFEPHLLERRIIDVDSWDGAASNYSSTAAYCEACLINLNEGPEEDWIQTNCKLPIRREQDSEGDFVRQAVFAAAARFNQVDAPEADLEAARSKLLSAYEEMGEEPPESLSRAISSQDLQGVLWNKIFELDAEIEGSDHYPVDMYLDENGIYALFVDRGKLYRYRLAIENDEVMFGEREQVVEIHQPVRTKTVIRQQEDERFRWFSVSGTAVLNRSGDIDSRELFDSFIAHAEATGEYPIRQFYHQGEAFKTGQADFLARDGFCYITSGLYDETVLAQAEVQARQNNPEFWGDSIGFLPTEEPELSEVADGIKIPVYRQGINKEISTLPENEAAHLFTRTEVTRMSLDGKAWEALIVLFGDEEKARQWIAENSEARNRAIRDASMITRDGSKELKELMILFNEDKDKALKWLEQRSNDPPLEDDPPVDDPPEDDPPGEYVVDESVILAITESETFTQLSDRLTQLETQLTELPAGVQVSEVEELRSTVGKLTKRLEALEKGEAAQQQQLADDTPAKFNGKTPIVYRPRTANAGSQGDSTPYSERALANMPKGVNY